MSKITPGMRRLLRRAVLTETGPDGHEPDIGEPKSLKPQARRLQRKVNFLTMRSHFLTAQTYLTLSILILLGTPLLPLSNQIVDMSAVRLCLYAFALTAMLHGLRQAFSMLENRFQIEII